MLLFLRQVSANNISHRQGDFYHKRAVPLCVKSLLEDGHYY